MTLRQSAGSVDHPINRTASPRELPVNHSIVLALDSAVVSETLSQPCSEFAARLPLARASAHDGRCEILIGLEPGANRHRAVDAVFGVNVIAECAGIF
jgi:hypothetical protein